MSQTPGQKDAGFPAMILTAAFIAILQFSSLPAGTLPEKPAQDSAQEMVIGGEVAARIPFQIQSGIILISVRINGSRDLRMYLDSGMSAPVVVLFHKESLTELGLKSTARIVVGGAGDQKPSPATLAAGAAVGLGGIELTGQSIVVFDDSRETSEWPVDGIIGKSLFDRYATEIDYEKETVTFYNPAGFGITGGPEPIPIDLSRGMPIFEGSIDIDGNKRIPVKLVADLGHRNALLLNQDPHKGILPPPLTVESIAGRGIQGEVPAKIGRIKELRLGGYSLEDIPTSFPEPGQNVGFSREIVAGNVGSLVWSRFRIVLDYANKRMFLSPNRDFSKTFELNMAGLVLEQDRDDVPFVRHTIEGSPAAESDIREGDKIVSIEGEDIRSYPYPEVTDIFTSEGRKVRLTIERNGVRFDTEVTLRRLV